MFERLGRQATGVLAILAIALASARGTAGAATSDPASGPRTEPDVTGKPNQSPAASSSVSIRRRADSSRFSWSTHADQYSNSYVNPTKWKLILNGCRSRGGTDAKGFVIPI